MSDSSQGVALVFGASGALGSAISNALEASGSQVVGVTRRQEPPAGWISVADSDWAAQIAARSVDRVVWAQGENASGPLSIESIAQTRQLLESNVMFILETLHALRMRDALADSARLVIVGSIWQKAARADKLAYLVSKSAVTGLVRSLAADLGSSGIAVNAVLPGVVESPMTRNFLSPSQIRQMSDETPAGRLVTPEEVASACVWLASSRSSGVNGQFICVDGGWSEVRHV
jgi:3-oxoacyl-[acyl-carrier protein] reductase